MESYTWKKSDEDLIKSTLELYHLKMNILENGTQEEKMDLLISDYKERLSNNLINQVHQINKQNLISQTNECKYELNSYIPYSYYYELFNL